jgi:CheY-like chemotaxis protein/CheY-specific phosphatase CheX
VSESPTATTIAQPFVAAVTETFDGLIGLEAIGTSVDAHEGDDHVSREGITALIEFSGPRFGVVLVTFPPEVARSVVERMLVGSGALEEGDVTDGVGELANIVSGRAKSVLSALGLGRLEMSVPTVITGFSLEDLGLADAEWSRIDFATEVGSFTLRVAFQSDQQQKVRVLIADDSRVMRKIERAALQGLADTVEFFEATDGSQAIKLVEEKAYGLDLLVLDLKMPEKDGYDVVAHVRKDPRGLKIPIAIVSSIFSNASSTAFMKGPAISGAIGTLTSPLGSGSTARSVTRRLPTGGGSRASPPRGARSDRTASRRRRAAPRLRAKPRQAAFRLRSPRCSRRSRSGS